MTYGIQSVLGIEEGFATRVFISDSLFDEMI